MNHNGKAGSFLGQTQSPRGTRNPEILRRSYRYLEDIQIEAGAKLTKYFFCREDIKFQIERRNMDRDGHLPKLYRRVVKLPEKVCQADVNGR
jgi:hypothetical protein